MSEVRQHNGYLRLRVLPVAVNYLVSFLICSMLHAFIGCTEFLKCICWSFLKDFSTSNKHSCLYYQVLRSQRQSPATKTTWLKTGNIFSQALRSRLQVPLERQTKCHTHTREWAMIQYNISIKLRSLV